MAPPCGARSLVPATLDQITSDADDVVVSCHACGALTDRVLTHALAAQARVAVVPCCHDVETCLVGPYTGWVDAALAIDIGRAARLEREGYTVWTQTIPSDITPKNRLLMGAPRHSGSDASESPPRQSQS